MFILSGGCCWHSEKFDRFAAFMGDCSIWIISIDFFGIQVFCQEKPIYFILGHLHKFISFPAFENALLFYILKLSLLDSLFALEQSLIQICPPFLFIFVIAVLFRQTQLLFPKALGVFCRARWGRLIFTLKKLRPPVLLYANAALDAALWGWGRTCPVSWHFCPRLYTLMSPWNTSRSRHGSTLLS